MLPSEVTEAGIDIRNVIRKSLNEPQRINNVLQRVEGSIYYKGQQTGFSLSVKNESLDTFYTTDAH